MQFLKNSLSLTTRIEDLMVEFPETELSPGVILERRVVLGGGLGLLGALFFPNSGKMFGQECSAVTSLPDETETIELETLIANLRPEARRLIASENPDEERYIQLAIAELTKVSKLETNRFMSSGKGDWEMDFQAFVPPLLLYQIRMSPNSVIELHDHRHYNGALTVREGSVLVRSFDIFQDDRDKKWDIAAGEVPALEEEFLIRENCQLPLKQGQAAGLTRTRDNLHQIEAGPDGCLLYDLFTNFKMNARSYEIKWDGQYFDPTKKLCKVTWVPPDQDHE